MSDSCLCTIHQEFLYILTVFTSWWKTLFWHCTWTQCFPFFEDWLLSWFGYLQWVYCENSKSLYGIQLEDNTAARAYALKWNVRPIKHPQCLYCSSLSCVGTIACLWSCITIYILAGPNKAGSGSMLTWRNIYYKRGLSVSILMALNNIITGSNMYVLSAVSILRRSCPVGKKPCLFYNITDWNTSLTQILIRNIQKNSTKIDFPGFRS